jgi:integrase
VNVRAVMRSVCDKADLRRRSPHHLLHTFASLLLQETGDIAYVSRQLGHADPAITLKVYTHWLPQRGSVPQVSKLDSLSEKVANRLQTARSHQAA